VGANLPETSRGLPLPLLHYSQGALLFPKNLTIQTATLPVEGLIYNSRAGRFDEVIARWTDRLECQSSAQALEQEFNRLDMPTRCV
jgi:hypothetical protein